MFSPWIVLQALVNNCQLDLSVLGFFAWRQKRYHPPSSCFIFYLITLILVSVAETGLGGKSPRKQSGKFLELWLKTFRFGLHYLELAVEVKLSLKVTSDLTRLRHCLNKAEMLAELLRPTFGRGWVYRSLCVL